MDTAAAQLVLSFDKEFDRYGPWVVTQRADKEGASLANRHYSRRTVGSAHYTRPGKRNLVLRTVDGDAVWVSYYGEWRKDGLDAWENTLFRNESCYLSSDLVRWAIFATQDAWGDQLPKDGFITYVKPSAVKSENPGCNYLAAGFSKAGYNKSGELLLLQLSADKMDSLLHEVKAIKKLEECQKYMQLALCEGEYAEAGWFYNEARKTEEYLRTMKSAKQRLNKKKKDCFDTTIDSFELLHEMCEGWIPEEMMDYIQAME